jgi:3-oxoacyl-[acyl-carrier-protein] synthase II
MSDPNSLRIVVTGFGVVSPVGGTPARFWAGLTESCIENSANVPQGTAEFSGSLADFGDPPPEISRAIRKSLKVMNRETQMGVAAGQKALLASGVLGANDPERIGVTFAADNVALMPEDFQRGVAACTDSEGEFHIEDWGDHGLSEVAPLWLLKCLPNMPACHLAILNDLRGPNNTITQRDVSANLAIAEACRTIKGGQADSMLVGATGTLFPVFNRLHAELEEELVHDAVPVCRPFDKNRIGAAPGEGAGALVLEELHHALARGATVYGEILGHGAASVIGRDRVAACRCALTRSINQALGKAHRSPDGIGHVHAHGLGAKLSDVAEAEAIREVFGPRVPVVAAKSRLAHAGSGAGALELIASLIGLERGHLFPTWHLEEQDPDCPIRPVTTIDEPAGSSFLNLSLFGRGQASCVVVGLTEE